MNCSNCGAVISKSDKVCKTCKTPVKRSSKYDLILPISTNNTKVIDLIHNITKANRNIIENYLKKPRHKILSSISLSEGVKYQRMFSKIGYKVEIVKINERIIPTKKSSTTTEEEAEKPKIEREVLTLEGSETSNKGKSFSNWNYIYSSTSASNLYDLQLQIYRLKY